MSAPIQTVASEPTGRRLTPRVTVTRWSPNRSQRNDSIKLIVLHDTESHPAPGDRDLDGVASWFANPSSQVSAHVVVNGDGHSARCVNDNDKAWHVANYNPVSLGIEQIGFSTEGKRAWEHRHAELEEAARWIAQFSILHGVPIAHGRTWNGHVLKRGVVTHRSLGAVGGNHDDPSPQYPFSEVLDMARTFKRLRGH